MIDDRVFPQISDLYPDLSILTLASCATFNGTDSGNNQGRIYNINLLNGRIYRVQLTSATLHQKDTGDFREHCLEMEKMSKISGNCYLEISILYLDIILYCKLNGSSDPVLMTAEDFKYRQDKDTAFCISITCSQLVAVYIKLGDLDVNISISSLLWEELKVDKINTIMALDKEVILKEVDQNILRHYVSNLQAWQCHFASVKQLVGRFDSSYKSC